MPKYCERCKEQKKKTMITEEQELLNQGYCEACYPLVSEEQGNVYVV